PARRYQGQWTIDEDTTQFICNEGRFGNYYANHKDRLETAMIRADGEIEDCDWEHALLAARDALKKAADAGPDKVAILAGGRQTNEEYYLLSRLARAVLGTNQIDWRLDFTSDPAAQSAAQALTASDGDLAQLETKAYPVTLVINADLLDTVPVIGLKIKEAARRKQTRLAILDSRLDGWMSEHAAIAATSAPDRLAAGIEMIAASFGANDELPDDLKAIKQTIGGAERGLIVLGLDQAGGEIASQILPAAMKLLRALGAGWKFLPVTRGRNAKGAFASGAQTDRLPSGAINDDSARNRMAELWGTLKSDVTPGPSAPEILRRAAAGEIQTLLLHRCDELVHHPQRALIEKALAATPNVIVIDTFASWITGKASIVFPGAFFFETEGSLASADGTLLSLNQGNEPPGDAQEDWRILTSLLESLGAAAAYKKPADIFKELLACWKVPRQFNLDDLKLEGPGTESPQRPQAAIRKKARPNFKLQSSERPELQAAPPPPASPAKLRLLWHIAIQGPDHLAAHSDEFDKLRPEAIIELHPDDAAANKLAAGDAVKISGCRIESCKVVLNPTLPRGIAAGASNVLGLELPSDSAGLPVIELTKVSA
ncbi:molybdopterin-dependent oxidoreductase, partial [Candidatus Sumerlaeota bacterium]|nr:molybdopterin-dependent oxidoreductase [Candidatus Sumerlaeota bacterium]